MRPGTVHASDFVHRLRKLNAVGVAGRSFVLPHQQLDATPSCAPEPHRAALAAPAQRHVRMRHCPDARSGCETAMVRKRLSRELLKLHRRVQAVSPPIPPDHASNAEWDAWADLQD